MQLKLNEVANLIKGNAFTTILRWIARITKRLTSISRRIRTNSSKTISKCNGQDKCQQEQLRHVDLLYKKKKGLSKQNNEHGKFIHYVHLKTVELKHSK